MLMLQTTSHFLSHLGQARSLDEVVEFAQRCVPRETLDVPEEVLGLSLKQAPEGVTTETSQSVSQSECRVVPSASCQSLSPPSELHCQSFLCGTPPTGLSFFTSEEALMNE